MDDAFTLYFRVRYAECDAQQVVFNSRYAEYADLAATEFMRTVVGGYQTLIEQGMDNQVVSLTINWQRAAKFDDVLACQVQVTKMGKSSFTLSMQLRVFPCEQVVANMDVIYVLVDAEKLSSIPIPNELRETLQQGAAGQQVNLAGVDLETGRT